VQSSATNTEPAADCTCHTQFSGQFLTQSNYVPCCKVLASSYSNIVVNNQTIIAMQTEIKSGALNLLYVKITSFSLKTMKSIWIGYKPRFSYGHISTPFSYLQACRV
jgi:hypothetical protein